MRRAAMREAFTLRKTGRMLIVAGGVMTTILVAGIAVDAVFIYDLVRRTCRFVWLHANFDLYQRFRCSDCRKFHAPGEFLRVFLAFAVAVGELITDAAREQREFHQFFHHIHDAIVIG